MILIKDENSLGHSYYLDYDDDDLYYYYDDDEWDDGYYSDNYVEDFVVDYADNYLSGYTGYYYPSYTTYYDDYYYDDYYDEYYYEDDYYYDRRYSKNSLTINGDTLKVGSNYNSNIWLSDNSRYSNIRVIDDRDNGKDLIIAGNSRNNSILSGDGDTTLYGGGGSSNTLVGDDGSRNVFWYKSGSTDYAVNFISGDRGESDIVRLSEANWSNIQRDNSGIVFNMTDGNFLRLRLGHSNYEEPILYTMDGSNIERMKVARNDTNTLTYRKDTKYYQFEQNGRLKVVDGNNNIWLNGEAGQNFANTQIIDATQSYGSNVLMGNTGSNIIYTGNGNTTLWGGAGNAIDTLAGGLGVDNFRYARSEGNDIIYSGEAHDVITLYNSTLSDIVSLHTDDYCVLVTFNTGEVLTVGNSTPITPTFQLSDGSRYNYNRETKSWQNA